MEGYNLGQISISVFESPAGEGQLVTAMLAELNRKLRARVEGQFGLSTLKLLCDELGTEPSRQVTSGFDIPVKPFSVDVLVEVGDGKSQRKHYEVKGDFSFWGKGRGNQPFYGNFREHNLYK